MNIHHFNGKPIALAVAILFMSNASVAIEDGNNVVAGSNAKSGKIANVALGMEAEAGSQEGMATVAIGYQANAQKNFALAIGPKSVAKGGQAIGIGFLAKALKEDAVAIGKNASAAEEEAIALGIQSSANGRSSIAVGFNSESKEEFGIAVGMGAEAKRLAVAMGTNSLTGGESAISMGTESIASGKRDIALGFQAQINPKINLPDEKGDDQPNEVGETESSSYSIAIGADAFIGKYLGTVPEDKQHQESPTGYSDANIVGSIDPSEAVSDKEKYSFSTVVGSGAKGFGNGNTSLGASAESFENNSTALGSTAKALKNYATAIGFSSKAKEVNTVAVGVAAAAVRDSSMAIGSWSSVNVEDGVSIGSNSSNERAKGQFGFDFRRDQVMKEENLANFDKDKYKALLSKIEIKQTEIKEKKAAVLALEKEIKSDSSLDEKARDKAFSERKTPLLNDYIKARQELNSYLLAVNEMTAGYKSSKGAVSVGDAVKKDTRQIIGVAAGSEDTDAVNVRQLKDVTERTVFGEGAKGIDVEGAVAIGKNSQALATNSVALGSRSKTDESYHNSTGYLMDKPNNDAENGVVSVGSSELTRRIVNVAPGMNDNDAVTVSQLKKIQTELAQSSRSQSSSEVKINKLNQRMNQFDHRINDLDKRVKHGLASSAALSALYQPYGIKKYNVTAAIGGYKSTTALAVGTGYRFSEGFSAKAGLAFSGSKDLTYNAAMNLEW